MKITGIRVQRLSHALDPPFHAAWDPTPRRNFEATLVFVDTSEGLTGVGSRSRTPSAPAWTWPTGWLPRVMTFNLPASTRELALAALSLGASDPDASEETNANATIAATDMLVTALLGRRTLASFGVTEDLIPTLVRDTVEDGVIVNAPLMPSPEEVEDMLRSPLRA